MIQIRVRTLAIVVVVAIVIAAGSAIAQNRRAAGRAAKQLGGGYALLTVPIGEGPCTLNFGTDLFRAVSIAGLANQLNPACGNRNCGLVDILDATWLMGLRLVAVHDAPGVIVYVFMPT